MIFFIWGLIKIPKSKLRRKISKSLNGNTIVNLYTRVEELKGLFINKGANIFYLSVLPFRCWPLS